MKKLESDFIFFLTQLWYKLHTTTPMNRPEEHFQIKWGYALVAVRLSGIEFGKQKLDVTSNFHRQDVIYFTEFSKLNMCRASEAKAVIDPLFF